MSSEFGDTSGGASDSASHLLARGAADDVRADRRIFTAIDDFLLADDARLDDRLRARLSATLSAVIGGIEDGLRQHAARLLAADGQTAMVQAIADGPGRVQTILTHLGLINDPALIRELLARVREIALADALATVDADEQTAPGVLMRIAEQADPVIAAAAAALMAAEAIRRDAATPGAIPRSDLPAELHHRLVWRAAAALRAAAPVTTTAMAAALDRALTGAALRSIAAHDEGDRAEAAAMRLAVAIDAAPDEMPVMLVEALGDRRVGLFSALLAHALGMAYDGAREILLDPVPDRLWLALRALDIDRATIARIAVMLCEAEPRRDVERFAEQIDAIALIHPDQARAGLAQARLHPDFREAVMTLAKARPA